MSNYKQEAFEMYQNGYGSKAEIARTLKVKYSLSTPQDTLRRSISKYIHKQESRGLQEECEKVGLPMDNVSHYWYKGKHYSINVKGSNIPSWEDVKEDLIFEMKSHAYNYGKIQYPKQTNGHLLVVDPADVHIGKLASAMETGETYDSQTAVARVIEGVHGILEKAEGFKVDQILFVGGNDILHIDTPKRMTTSGTPQDTDGMWYENFLTAKKLYVHVLELLMEKAPVHFCFNPSNHDYTNGFFLADVIQSWFHNCEAMTFDCSIAHRKYYRYFNNLIGTTHGDGAKPQDLPLLMAQEAAADWADTKHRYVYTHHVHHKVAKDFIGVTVESLRSPSGTDSWHHRNGYQHNPKAIEGFLHSKEHGQVARLTHIF